MDYSDGLVVDGNTVSDFYSRFDATFGISVPLNGRNVINTTISNNEVSATRTFGDNSSGNEQNPTSQEVRIGIEAGGGTYRADDPDFDPNCRVINNTIHGVGTGISMETSYKLHVNGNHIWNYEFAAISNAHATSPDVGTNDTTQVYFGAALAAVRAGKMP